MTAPAPSAPRSRQHAAIRAAGAVCWRVHARELQVLLIHRPRYDDWSWPKGKLDPGEHPPTAAVREVEEETGITINLGLALPTARYRISDAGTKTVMYWAAQVPDNVHPTPPRPREVDRTAWVTPEEADKMLTRRGDRAQLAAVVTAWEEGVLDTWPLLVVRHGHAHPRAGWGHEDARRPLVEAGQAQARDLAALLPTWAPGKILSSPWVRCVSTVAPFAAAVGAKVRTKGKLSEDGHRRDPRKTAALVAKQIAKGKPVALCTHRPVLGTVLGVLAGHSVPGVGRELPANDPFLKPGEILVAHVSRRNSRIVAVERHQSST